MIKVAMSGRFFAGKNYVAQQAGLREIGFADPMYLIADHFFGTSDKSLPSMRGFLQEVGQLGRGHVDDKYPATLERAQKVQLIRNALPEILGEDPRFCDIPHGFLNDYGRSQDFWIDILLDRTDLDCPEGVAIVNARFENEIEALGKGGFHHWHVMSSQITRERRGAPGIESPLNDDISEKMASLFDRYVQDGISPLTNWSSGVVWNDESVPCINHLVMPVQDFVRQVKSDQSR